MNDEQRRSVEHLHAQVVDIKRRIDSATKTAEDDLPKGAIPGLLGTAGDWVKAVQEILEATLKQPEDPS
jgi:hypothetical protein